MIWQLLIVILFCNVTHILEEFRTEKQMGSKPIASIITKLMGVTQLIRLPCPNEFLLGFNSKIVLLYSKNYLIINYYDVQSKSLGILLKYDDLV